MTKPEKGSLMRAESAQAANVLLRALRTAPDMPKITRPTSIYTLARGSSDAAATVLNYEIMTQAGIPATTLPPSVYSIGTGVALDGVTVLTLSQSGGSEDLSIATKGAAQNGAATIAITNEGNSPVEATAQRRIAINAGPERAVPATKTVVGTIGAGAALLASWDDIFAKDIASFAESNSTSDLQIQDTFPADLAAQIAGAARIFVVGRGGLLGAAQEVALKIKECCAVHAEAISASEVLHGPMQIAQNGLLTLLLDGGDAATRDSLILAEEKLTEAGCDVIRLPVAKFEDAPAALQAAVMLISLYPVILDAALSLGLDPDAPSSLKKVTVTR